MEIEGNINFKLKVINFNDIDLYKIRKGKVGEFIKYFIEIEIVNINNKINKILLDFYGYKL